MPKLHTPPRALARYVSGLLVGTILTCALPLSPAAAATHQSAPCAPPERADYVGGYDGSRTAAVIFVHGVLSNHQEAWTADNGRYWPCLLREDPAFHNSNIYVYNYPAGFGRSPRIAEVGTALMQDLANAGVMSRHARVVIVAHSMGGLVTASALQQMLDRHEFKEQVERLKLVLFFGAPGTGADIARIADIFSDNLQFEEMRARTDPSALVNRWNTTPWPFKWFCMAEGRRTGYYLLFGTRVVPYDSAMALCTNRGESAQVEIGSADHITLVKPLNLASRPHEVLHRYFGSCVREAVYRPTPPSKAQSAEGQAVLQTLDQLRQALAPAQALAGAIPTGARASIESHLDPRAAGSYMLQRPAANSLRPDDVSAENGSNFGHEFAKAFVDQPQALKAEWVGTLAASRELASDGQYTELLRDWQAAGVVSADNWVAVLPLRGLRSRSFVIFGIETDAAKPVAQVRHLLRVPEQATHCP